MEDVICIGQAENSARRGLGCRPVETPSIEKETLRNDFFIASGARSSYDHMNPAKAEGLIANV